MAANSGGKGTKRSETVTVRFDPRLRYLVELGSRKQRRTVSSFVEVAVEAYLSQVDLTEETTVASEAVALWEPEECERFARLAKKHPELLDHEEQLTWSFIRGHPLFWADTHWTGDGLVEWSKKNENLVLWKVRRYWPKIKAIVRGEAADDTVPLHDLKPIEGPPEEEIPF